MEARAGPLIVRMLLALDAAERRDFGTVIEALSDLQRSLREIGKLLDRMDERCSPDIFYHRIRPLLAGSLNMEAAGLPHGVFYDEGNGKGQWRKVRGGSNGQSSLIQFFDAVLGVEHVDKASFHLVSWLQLGMKAVLHSLTYDFRRCANTCLAHTQDFWSMSIPCLIYDGTSLTTPQTSISSLHTMARSQV